MQSVKRRFLGNPKYLEAIKETLSRGEAIGGQEVEKLEKHLSEWIGAFVVTCASGTDALWLACKALGIGRGAVVGVPALTFIATASAAVRAGASILPIDVQPDTWTMAIPKDRAPDALIPVDLFGLPFDTELSLWAKARKIPVIEDACQAFGASRHGQHAGTLGTIGCLSFYPTKPLGCFGDGGAVVTKSKPIADRVRSLAHHGARPIDKYRSFLPGGTNSRLDAIQAAVLNVALCDYYQQWIQRRVLKENILNAANCQTQVEREGYASAIAQVAILTNKRARIMRAFMNAMIHYPVPIHRHPCFKAQHGHRKLPVAESICRHIVSLPIEDSTPDILERILK